MPFNNQKSKTQIKNYHNNIMLLSRLFPLGFWQIFKLPKNGPYLHTETSTPLIRCDGIQTKPFLLYYVSYDLNQVDTVSAKREINFIRTQKHLSPFSNDQIFMIRLWVYWKTFSNVKTFLTKWIIQCYFNTDVFLTVIHGSFSRNLLSVWKSLEENARFLKSGN